MHTRLATFCLLLAPLITNCVTRPKRATPEAIDQFAERLLKNGGFTVSSDGTDLAGTGLYAVSAYPEHSMKLTHRPSAHDILAFRTRNKDLLKLPQHSLGGWCEGDNAKPPCWLDVTITLNDREKAVAIGKACNQQSVAHLMPKIKFISTGGDGNKISGAALKACHRSIEENL